MFLDSNLKLEIISLLLGKEIKPYDKKRRGKTANILSVDDFHLHNLIGKRQANVKKPLISEEDFFDPEHDCDFTSLSDSTECTRGDERYKRPKGWYRIALKVKGKYPDGDTWLGTKGWRNHSVPGEWPVSYHGTSLKGAKGIVRSHYKAGNRDAYGRGIYSTPDIHVAEREEYAQTLTSKTTGKSYKVILQNRINPVNREICERFDYWLIPVHEGTSAKEERKIVESSIRPYGILIKELNDDDEEDGAGDCSDNDDEDNDDDEDNNDGDRDSKNDDGSIIDSYDDDDGHDDGNHDHDDDDDDNECVSDNSDDDEHDDGCDYEVDDDDDDSNNYGNLADIYNEDDCGNDDDGEDDDDGNVNDSCDEDDGDDEDDVENDDCGNDDGDDEDDVENDDCEDDDGDDEDDVENDDCEDDDGDDEDDVENRSSDDNGDDDDNEHYDDDDNDGDSQYDDDNVDSICNDDDDDDCDDADGSGSEDDDWS